MNEWSNNQKRNASDLEAYNARLGVTETLLCGAVALVIGTVFGVALFYGATAIKPLLEGGLK